VELPGVGGPSGPRQQVAGTFACDTVGLAMPVIEVREVVESFRSCRVVVDGWAEIVREGVTAMTAFERRHPGMLPTLAGVATELDVLLRVGWDDATLLDTLSAALAALLPAVVPAGVPRPDDEQTWAFSPT
jgi:hypothetical protein